MQHFKKSAIESAFKAGEVLRGYWGKLKHIREKSHAGDLVTEADQASEDAILSHLKNDFPDHTYLAEESGMSVSQKSPYTWIIDPLDGTTNYTHQYPMVAISIALQKDNERILGVVYHPIFDELFVAVKGEGATLNNHPIHVSQTDTLQKALLATGFAYDRQEAKQPNYREFCYLTHTTHGVRRGGSAALDLAYVAAGRLDGFWERGLQPWDVAAGEVLVKEAGGKVTDLNTSAFDPADKFILASNGSLHENLKESLSRSKDFEF